MRHQKVVAFDNLPVRLPIVSTVVGFLVLDRFHAPDWAWMVLSALWLGLWSAAVSMKMHQTQTMIFRPADLTPAPCRRCRRQFVQSIEGFVLPHPINCAELARREEMGEVK